MSIATASETFARHLRARLLEVGWSVRAPSASEIKAGAKAAQKAGRKP